MSILKFNPFLVLLIVWTIGFSSDADAQLRIPNGLNWTGHNDGGAYVIIGRNNNAHNNSVDLQHKLTVDANTTSYGSRVGIYSVARTNALTGQSRGVAKAGLSTANDWFANGALVGVTGLADSVSILNVDFAGHGSAAVGGSFYTRVFDPIQDPTIGTYHIVGARSTLDGNIATFPDAGVVAAFYAEDRIHVPGTWGSYVDGRGYYRNEVGIGTQNPASMLSVNGDGNANYSAYAYSNSANSGSTAIFGEAATGAGFADHAFGVRGFITSGTGYTYGVRGDAIDATAHNSGRAYGVFANAGNATNGANYGLYAQLSGQNTGTAVLGFDRVNHSAEPDLLNIGIDKTWAGYFIGDMHITNKLGINCKDLNPSILPTTSVDYHLIVNGGILGTELYINNSGWCDYVFEEDYELTPLEAVEAHIQEKGHLHNTPSAAQIEAQQGFEVGEMTRNQQEKIEEIYLHLIDLNKQVKALKAENEALRTQLAQKTSE